jgi:hypothetical protein
MNLKTIDCVEVGRQAFRRGVKLSENPYICGPSYTKWKNGWYEERAAWLREHGGREL